MENDNSFDIMPWLKSDLLSGFSDLLDDRILDAELHGSAVTLHPADLGVGLPAAPYVDLSTDQVKIAAATIVTEWPRRSGLLSLGQVQIIINYATYRKSIIQPTASSI